MWTAYNYLSENYPAFDRDRFLPASTTIQQSLDAIDSWYATLIPFLIAGVVILATVYSPQIKKAFAR
jgi:hypothetical protein